MIGERKGGCFASEQVVPETGPDGWRLLLLFFSGTFPPEKTRTLFARDQEEAEKGIKLNTPRSKLAQDLGV
jgi:hypothetical protein